MNAQPVELELWHEHCKIAVFPAAAVAAIRNGGDLVVTDDGQEHVYERGSWSAIGRGIEAAGQCAYLTLDPSCERCHPDEG
jgi:hypothetical protein